MGDVVYGRFNPQQFSVGSATYGGAAAASEQPQFGAEELAQHPMKSLEQDFASQVRTLGELAALLADPHTDPEVAGPLLSDLVALQGAGHKIAQTLAQARGDDAAFLAVQTELKTWVSDVKAFEDKVLRETNYELVEHAAAITAPTPQTQVLPQQPRKFPVMWLGVGLVAAGGLTWFAVSKWSAPKKRRTAAAPPEKPFKKVKLRRALPAR